MLKIKDNVDFRLLEEKYNLAHEIIEGWSLLKDFIKYKINEIIGSDK